jgi:hypothetical protein
VSLRRFGHTALVAEVNSSFFDRVSQSFKREQWPPIVREIRTLWYECTQRTGSVESAVRLLVEMMCPGK